MQDPSERSTKKEEIDIGREKWYDATRYAEIHL